MTVWEEDGCWIQESYILAMHTPIGVKYPRKMLRKFLEITKDKTEAMVNIPNDDIYKLFIKHYNLELIDDNNKLYLATRKD